MAKAPATQKNTALLQEQQINGGTTLYELFQQFVEVIRIPTLIGAVFLFLYCLHRIEKSGTSQNPKLRFRLVAQLKPSVEGQPLEKGCFVHLHWNGVPVSEDWGMFMLYKVNELGERTVLCTTDDFCWMDTAVKIGEEYTYHVKTVGYGTRDGRRGESYSNKVFVKIEGSTSV